MVQRLPRAPRLLRQGSGWARGRSLRSTNSSYPTSICHPGTEYCAYDNTQHVQNVFIPAFRTDGDISIECLKPDEIQNGYRASGYKRGSDHRHLFVIAWDHIDNYNHERSRGNNPRDRNYVCAFNQHPIHIRRFPKRIQHVISMEKAEGHSDRVVRGEPSQEACRNCDDPSKVGNGDVITHGMKRASE